MNGSMCNNEGGFTLDAQTCLKKLEYVHVLAFANVDAQGAPQVRNISAIHYEPDAMYFFTARGKAFCRELLADGRVQALGYTKYREMIRLAGVAAPVPQDEQRRWIDLIFSEQPGLGNLYPGDARYIGMVFCIKDAQIEYFNLGVNPILRERYAIGDAKPALTGFRITDACIGCGACKKLCPMKCISEGTPYQIDARHCLHCGVCTENCPVGAIVALEEA